MTIDELRTEIDFALQEAVGFEVWRHLNVWVTCRSSRIDSATWSIPTYSIEVDMGGDSTRIDRGTPSGVLAAFAIVALPRIKAWVGQEVPA